MFSSAFLINCYGGGEAVSCYVFMFYVVIFGNVNPKIKIKTKELKNTTIDKMLTGKGIKQRGMEEDPENGKELSHSAHGNGMNE